MSDVFSTPEMRAQLLMKCLDRAEDPTKALAQAAAMTTFIDTGEVQAAGLPLALPKPCGAEVPHEPKSQEVQERPKTDTADASGARESLDSAPPPCDGSDIARDARGRVKWTDPDNLARLKSACGRGGLKEACRVFDAKEHAIRQAATKLDVSIHPSHVEVEEKVATEPPVDIPVPTVKVKAAVAPGEPHSPPRPAPPKPTPKHRPKRKGVDGDKLQQAVLWLEGNDYELIFDDGLYDACPRGDEDAGRYSLDKLELVIYAESQGFVFAKPPFNLSGEG